jgi:glycosyltransferase involved in cell wall biosynthesis
MPPRERDVRPCVLVYVGFGESGEVRGGPRSMLLTARNLRRYRPAFVVTRPTSYTEDVRAAGIPIHVLDTPHLLMGIRAAPWRERLRRASRLTAHGREVVRVARSVQARVFHCQDPAEALGAGLACRMAGLRVVMHIRDQSSGARGGSFALAAAVASRVVYVSEPLMREYLDMVPPRLRGWLERRSIAIPNGIDVSFIDRQRSSRTAASSREALGLPGNGFYLTVVGPHEPKKNQLALIEAAGSGLLALGPDVHLLFVGSDASNPAYAAQVRAAAARLPAQERIHFIPDLPHGRMWDVYAATDSLLIPSQVEGLPRVALEGQAMGCPVVAARNRGSEGAIVDGETGYLVPLSDLGKTIDGVARLRDDELRARISRQAQQYARRAFDVQQVTPRIEAVYDDVLGGGRAADVRPATGDWPLRQPPAY